MTAAGIMMSATITPIIPPAIVPAFELLPPEESALEEVVGETSTLEETPNMLEGLMSELPLASGVSMK
jgi:hypothetical protein